MRRGGAAGGGDAGQLGRAVKGLLNRLTEGSLRASVAQGAELLQQYSRAQAIAALTEELLQARFQPLAPAGCELLNCIQARLDGTASLK